MMAFLTFKNVIILYTRRSFNERVFDIIKNHIHACHRENRLLPDFKEVYLKITGSHHTTLFEQWIEYKEKYSNGYEYT